MLIKIATRKSKLALVQTDLFIVELKRHFPDFEYQVVPVVTSGDKILDKNLYDIGGKALFLKELEEKLLNGEVDLAIHSLKDVPGILPDKLEIGAVLEREDPRDCLVSYRYRSLEELPQGAIVGSSSIRRKVILQKVRPDLQIRLIRGNIETRFSRLLTKKGEGDFDAIILACAGLKRAGLFDETCCFPLSVDQMLPASGQGMIAVEKRADDHRMSEVCNMMNHMPSWYLAQAEREFLAYFDASCRTPISAYAEYIDENTLKASYMYGDFEGKYLRFHTEIGDKTRGKEVAIRAAERILQSFSK